LVGGVAEIDRRLTLPVENGEGQRLALIDDGGTDCAGPGSAVVCRQNIKFAASILSS
jgi:hypothetical protein